MFCKYCGKEIADEAVVCIGCGRPVQPLKPTIPPSMPSNGAWSSGAMTGLVIATILMPIIGLILGVIFMSNNSASQERKKQARTLLIVGCSIIAALVLLYFILIVDALINSP